MEPETRREPEPGPGPEIRHELEAIPDEPLLPVEKKLIIWSLILGVVLLALLAWVSFTFFPPPVPGQP